LYRHFAPKNVPAQLELLLSSLSHFHLQADYRSKDLLEVFVA
jgi:hypothetical protein